MEEKNNYEAPDSQITLFNANGEDGISGATGVTLPDHDWDI